MHSSFSPIPPVILPSRLSSSTALPAEMASIFVTSFLSSNLAQPVCRASNLPLPSPFLLSRYRSRKEVHTALETALKNDYSEINNNDITACRDRYARKWFSSADLDSLGV
jgi:hypothetical protein